MHGSAKTKIFFHDDEFTCLWTWIFVSFSQLSVQKSTAIMKNFLVLFWSWASSDSDQQQQKRWSGEAVSQILYLDIPPDSLKSLP